MQCQEALDKCRSNKSIMNETNRGQLGVLQEMSSWCLQDLGTKMNRTKIETLVTIQANRGWCWFLSPVGVVGGASEKEAFHLYFAVKHSLEQVISYHQVTLGSCPQSSHTTPCYRLLRLRWPACCISASYTRRVMKG